MPRFRIVLLLCASLFTFSSLAVETVEASEPALQRKKKKEREKKNIEGDRFELPEQGLTLTFVGLDGFQEAKVSNKGSGGTLTRAWTGKIGPSEVAIEYWVMPRDKYGLTEPEDVVQLVEDDRYVTADRGVLDRILDEVRDRLFGQGRIAGDDEGRVRHDRLDGHLSCASEHREAGGHAQRDFSEVHARIRRAG